MKARGARTITYMVVVLLVVLALRYTPELPEHRPAEILQQGDSVNAAKAQLKPWSRRETLNRGETLIGLLKRVGVNDQAAHEVVQAATASAVDARYLRAGMPVDVHAPSADSAPSEMVFHLGVDRLLHMKHWADGWRGTEERLPWITDTVVVVGTIHANLYQAMDSSAAAFFPGHAKDELAWALADIFEYKVDMSRDLQDGDGFRALVQRAVGPEGTTRIDKILAASFMLSGKELSAIRFDSKGENGQYFDSAGKSLRAQFLRAPLEFRRISSTFGNRFHPILGMWRSHKGTDYAASAGTPVRAIGNAVVVRAGWTNGYGNMLELRHANGFVTRYGHLRAFAKGLHPGTHVGIGQTVAFVGMTGLATGPHLHFEVLVGGVQRDSRSALKSTGGEPILTSERLSFDAKRGEMLATLGGAEGVVRVAQTLTQDDATHSLSMTCVQRPDASPRNFAT